MMPGMRHHTHAQVCMHAHTLHTDTHIHKVFPPHDELPAAMGWPWYPLCQGFSATHTPVDSPSHSWVTAGSLQPSVPKQCCSPQRLLSFEPLPALEDKGKKIKK